MKLEVDVSFTDRQKYNLEISKLVPLQKSNVSQFGYEATEEQVAEWVAELPKGAHLLTYLCNVVIEMESDLGQIEYVR